MMTGAGELVLQTAGESRFVVDCKVKPKALVGHVKMIPLGGTPEGMMVSWAGDPGGNEGQLRPERKTEHRAIARTAACESRPVQGVTQ